MVFVIRAHEWLCGTRAAHLKIGLPQRGLENGIWDPCGTVRVALYLLCLIHLRFLSVSRITQLHG